MNFQRLLMSLVVAASLTSCSDIEKEYRQFLRTSARLGAARAKKNQQAAATKAGKEAENNLRTLTKLKGKYPTDVGLLDHPLLKRRLRNLLGNQYTYMKAIWEVEGFIVIEDGLLYAEGMQAHSGGDPSAVVMADLERNILYVGIHRKQEVHIYAEDDSPTPTKLQTWADEEVGNEE